MRPRLVPILLLACWPGPAQAAPPDWPGPRRDVRAFGARGDGVADDTRAIQAAIDSLPSSGGTVLLGRGEYRTRNLLIAEREGVRMAGVGATLRLFGRAAPPHFVGVQLHGMLRRVRIEGLTILGDGQVESRHAGPWMTTASHDMRELEVRGCVIRDVVNGIRFDNTQGRLERILVEGNRVERCVGTAPGEGYGIVHSNGGRTPGSAVILGNTVVGAQRHAIYQSAGSGAMILGNHVIDHRLGVADGRLRAAIAIARSRDILVAGNRLERCADVALSVEPSESAGPEPSGRVRVIGNGFFANPGRDVWVGAEVVGPETGRLERVAIEHNVFARPPDPANRTESIRIVDGRFVSIDENEFHAANGFRFAYAAIVATASDHSRLDGLSIAGNTAHLTAGEGGSGSLVELGAGIASGSRKVTIRGEGPPTRSAAKLVVLDGPRANPNLIIDDPAPVDEQAGVDQRAIPSRAVSWPMRVISCVRTLTAGIAWPRPGIGSAVPRIVNLNAIRARWHPTGLAVHFGGTILLAFEVAGDGVALKMITWIGISPPRPFITSSRIDWMTNP